MGAPRAPPASYSNINRAKGAEVYPNELCKDIIIGLHDQILADRRLGGEGVIGAVDAIDEVKLNLKDHHGVEFYDDVSGKPLPKGLTVKAREEEMTRPQA